MSLNTNSNNKLTELHASLQKLIGFHRQLLDTVRVEKAALVQAELRTIRETTCVKQALIESIRIEETSRVRLVSALAKEWSRPTEKLSLNEIMIEIQVSDPQMADQLRSAYNALTLLVARTVEQNKENARFVERSLDHISAMKRNVLGEKSPSTQTYTQQGTRTPQGAGSRLISKEA